MRRTTAIAIATLALLAAGAGIAREAHAIAACTAAQIIASASPKSRPEGQPACSSAHRASSRWRIAGSPAASRGRDSTLPPWSVRSASACTNLGSRLRTSISLS